MCFCLLLLKTFKAICRRSGNSETADKAIDPDSEVLFRVGGSKRTLPVRGGRPSALLTVGIT